MVAVGRITVLLVDDNPSARAEPAGLADSGQLGHAIREAATDGSMLAPEIVAAMLSPVKLDGALTADQKDLRHEVARGRPVKAPAAAKGAALAGGERHGRRHLPAVDAGRDPRPGQSARHRPRMLHAAIARREEALSRLLPGGLAERLRVDAGRRSGSGGLPSRSTCRTAGAVPR